MAVQSMVMVLWSVVGPAASLLGCPLEPAAQQALYADFCRIGEGLGIVELPPDYAAWRTDRACRLREDVAWARATAVLYQAYRRQLGPQSCGLRLYASDRDEKANP